MSSTNKEVVFYMSDLSSAVVIRKYRLTSPQQMFDAHQHRTILQFFLVESGQTHIFSNGKDHIMGASDCLLINCGDYHYGETLSGETVLVSYKFNLEPILASGLLTDADEAEKLGSLVSGMLRLEEQFEDEQVLSCLRTALAECERKRPGYQLCALSSGLTIIAQVLRNHTVYSALIPGSSRNAQHREKMDMVIAYIDKNYHQRITLCALANVAHMSEGHLCRQFRACTGSTPIDYINRIRIEKSAYLLSNGADDITRVSQACGFDDPSYFSRMFKRYMKKTPLEFKKSTDRIVYL